MEELKGEKTKGGEADRKELFSPHLVENFSCLSKSCQLKKIK